MIVIGVRVHKQLVTAVAVDEAGRMLDEKTVAVGGDGLVGWAAGLGGERLWAVEDCRQLTRWLERQLLAIGEELVRVPPKLMAPERRAGRARGKSDPSDAPAAARLRSCDCGEAARRDRTNRSVQERRATRAARRRRTARSKLRPRATTPTRPRWQPPAQRGALPDRDHTSALPP